MPCQGMPWPRSSSRIHLATLSRKVAIVRHRDHGARIFLEIALQPGHRFGIQVIGRLIQQQHVGLRQQQPAQRHAALLAAGELRDLVPPRAAAAVRRRRFPACAPVPSRRPHRSHPAASPAPRAACSSARSSIGSANRSLIRLKRSSSANVPPTPSMTTLRTSLFGVELRLLRQEADPDAGLRARLAVDVLVDAGHDPQQRWTCPSRSGRARRSWRRERTTG